MCYKETWWRKKWIHRNVASALGIWEVDGSERSSLLFDLLPPLFPRDEYVADLHMDMVVQFATHMYMMY